LLPRFLKPPLVAGGIHDNAAPPRAKTGVLEPTMTVAIAAPVSENLRDLFISNILVWLPPITGCAEKPYNNVSHSSGRMPHPPQSAYAADRGRYTDQAGKSMVAGLTAPE
jgi:hypothetical protein